MRVHTSIRQRSFRPRRQGTHEPHDARKRGGTAKPLARARISWKLDHPGISTPLREMLLLNPNLLPQYHSSKVLPQISAVRSRSYGRQNRPFIRTASIVDFTLGEWR